MPTGRDSCGGGGAVKRTSLERAFFKKKSTGAKKCFFALSEKELKHQTLVSWNRLWLHEFESHPPRIIFFFVLVPALFLLLKFLLLALLPLKSKANHLFPKLSLFSLSLLLQLLLMLLLGFLI
jgi:hypothetical protein